MISRFINDLIRNTCLYPNPVKRTLLFNFLRSRTFNKGRLSYVIFTKYSIFDVHRTAKIIVNGLTWFGYKKVRNSHLETSLWMDKYSCLEINGGAIFSGCDIQVFDNAHLSIGKCSMNRNVQILCMDKITIGDGCLISRDVIIRDNDGGHSILSDSYKKTSPVHIGNHVWIGQGAIIMKGVTIGDGAIIGAKAFVATNVKPNSLVMCDPSRTFARDQEWKEK